MEAYRISNEKFIVSQTDVRGYSPVIKRLIQYNMTWWPVVFIFHTRQITFLFEYLGAGGGRRKSDEVELLLGETSDETRVHKKI